MGLYRNLTPVNRQMSNINNFDDQFWSNCDMCCKPPPTPTLPASLHVDLASDNEMFKDGK